MKNFRSLVPVLGLSISVLIFAACLVGGVYSFRHIPPQPSQPLAMLAAEPAVVDLGQVGPAFHEATVKLVNSSKYPIAILDIKMTCSCTQVSFSRKTIAAGENTELRCLFDTNGKEGKTGAKLAVIYVPQTDDADVDTAPHLLSIDLLANVKPLDQLPAVVSLTNRTSSSN
jgi:hypothetical protein